MRAVLLALVLLPGAATAAGFAPFGTPDAPVTVDTRAERHRSADPFIPPAHFFWLSFRFYQSFVSPIDGARCSHYPTCSAYAMQAVQRRGIFEGMLLTIDRLWMTDRSSSLRRWPLIEVGGRLRVDHPVHERPGPEDLE